MQRKFRVLRVISTVWKVLAWIELVLGVLAAIGVLLFGIFGMLGLQQYQGQPLPGMPWQVAGPIGGVIGFFVTLIIAVLYFLMLYAVGEGIFLFIAIEENTRMTVQRLGYLQQSLSYASPPDSSVYSSPPPAMQE